jgi:hypothetical protein
MSGAKDHRTIPGAAAIRSNGLSRLLVTGECDIESVACGPGNRLTFFAFEPTLEHAEQKSTTTA